VGLAEKLDENTRNWTQFVYYKGPSESFLCLEKIETHFNAALSSAQNVEHGTG